MLGDRNVGLHGIYVDVRHRASETFSYVPTLCLILRLARNTKPKAEADGSPLSRISSQSRPDYEINESDIAKGGWHIGPVQLRHLTFVVNRNGPG